ncbi:hypothetical protein ACLOJK_014762, partial [Asimina triloba]
MEPSCTMRTRNCLRIVAGVNPYCERWAKLDQWDGHCHADDWRRRLLLWPRYESCCCWVAVDAGWGRHPGWSRSGMGHDGV